jgi:hypothetical protein
MFFFLKIRYVLVQNEMVLDWSRNSRFKFSSSARSPKNFDRYCFLLSRFCGPFGAVDLDGFIRRLKQSTATDDQLLWSTESTAGFV